MISARVVYNDCAVNCVFTEISCYLRRTSLPHCILPFSVFIFQNGVLHVLFLLESTTHEKEPENGKENGVKKICKKPSNSKTSSRPTAKDLQQQPTLSTGQCFIYLFIYFLKNF